VIALLWCLTIIVSIAVVMFGIYLIVRVRIDLADELRMERRRSTDLLHDISKLQTLNNEQKVEIARLKNRKVHDADTE
jgi:hypothetical protein